MTENNDDDNEVDLCEWCDKPLTELYNGDHYCKDCDVCKRCGGLDFDEDDSTHIDKECEERPITNRYDIEDYRTIPPCAKCGTTWWSQTTIGQTVCDKCLQADSPQMVLPSFRTN